MTYKNGKVQKRKCRSKAVHGKYTAWDFFTKENQEAELDKIAEYEAEYEAEYSD